MKSLQFAITHSRHDLAAHVLVYSALKVLNNGGSPHAKRHEKATAKPC